MDLVGRLSNPSGPFRTVIERGHVAEVANEPAPTLRPDLNARHRHVGWVTKAVEQVLAAHGEPMRAKAVHAAVETSLGKAVPWSSVKNALSDGASGHTPRFTRIERGLYRIAS